MYYQADKSIAVHSLHAFEYAFLGELSTHNQDGYTMKHFLRARHFSLQCCGDLEFTISLRLLSLTFYGSRDDTDGKKLANFQQREEVSISLFSVFLRTNAKTYSSRVIRPTYLIPSHPCSCQAYKTYQDPGVVSELLHLGVISIIPFYRCQN